VYADDVQLYLSCSPNELKDAIGIMNFILDDIFKWSEKHGLMLNPNMTQALIIAPQNVQAKIDFSALPKLILNGVNVVYVVV
jgi:hypothetical protein